MYHGNLKKCLSPLLVGLSGEVDRFIRINVWTFLRDFTLFESYLNCVLFVVTVLCYSVMNMKYFRYIGIIDEYVKKRAEKFDSATIMKMK